MMSTTNVMFESFNKNYSPYKLELKHQHYDIHTIGHYNVPQKMYVGSTVDITLDGELFKKMVQSLYEVNEDEKVRRKSEAVQRAYDNYKMLLELSRE